MLSISAGFLAVLALLNRRVSRTWAYPPAVFCLVWSAALSLLWSFQTLFFEVQKQTLVYFVLGALAFSAGGAVVLALRMHPVQRAASMRPSPAAISLGLDVGLAGLVLCFPLYLRFMQYAGSLATSTGSNSAEQLRRGSMMLANDPNRDVHFETSLLPLAIILALLAYHEYRGGAQRRWRTLATVLLAAVYTVATEARSELMVLLVGLAGVGWLRHGHLPKRVLAIAAGFFLVVFTYNQISLEKMNAQANASLSENLPAVANGLVTYAIGGIVAFDYTVSHPGAVVNQWKLTKPIARIANRFGADMDEPSRHLAFTEIAPGQETNVYTLYFPFQDDGPLLCGLWLALLGAAATLAFRYGVRGRPLAVLSYGFALYAIVMSVFAEEFFARLDLYVKSACIILLLYGVAPKLMRSMLGARARLVTV